MGKDSGMQCPNANVRKPHPSLAACAAVNHIRSSSATCLPNCRMTNRRIDASLLVSVTLHAL